MVIKSTGTELVKACEQYLTMKGVFHYRNNSGALKTVNGGFMRFGAVGSPDIICVVKGIYVGLECKMGSGRLSEAQVAFKERLQAVGGQYWIIRDLQDLIDIGL